MQSVVQEKCENPQALVAQGFEPLFFLGLKGEFLGLLVQEIHGLWADNREGIKKPALPSFDRAGELVLYWPWL